MVEEKEVSYLIYFFYKKTRLEYWRFETVYADR